MEYPRTTVRIEPKLLKAAKKYSQEKNTSLQQVINWGLELLIEKRSFQNEKTTRTKSFRDKLPKLDLPQDYANSTFDRDQIYGDSSR